MNIYRNRLTRQLVHIFEVRSMKVSGSWLEAQDIRTRAVTKHIRMGDYDLVSAK